MTDKKIVPIFYACDDAFVKFTIISIRSMLENASPDRFYRFHILITDVSERSRRVAKELERENAEIIFEDVTSYLTAIEKKLPLRDYYSKTTYYRLFIADMFPQYDKAIYIDSDTVVLGDISELYDTDLKDNYVGAVTERVMTDVDVYGRYVEQVLGIDRYAYFNAGLLLLNCKQFRKNDLLKKFGDLLSVYNFVVTQDEDYLNLMCKDRVLHLDRKWNTEILPQFEIDPAKVAIFHYIMVSKPWHYPDCRFGEYFWKYAEKTEFYQELRESSLSYSDEEKQRDIDCGNNLALLAEREIAREDNYLKTLRKKQAQDRVAVIEKIGELEAKGKFDVDAEDDPPTIPLEEDVDYAKKKLISRMKAAAAFKAARVFVNNLIENKQLIMKDIVGLENLTSLEGGAIITCNHFNAFDSFAMQLVYDHADTKKHKFFRVVREGNYTNFPGFYGFLMRNCNTLPLSSGFKNMQKFMSSVSEILKDGHFILVYPEQSMWWNYRKPKPLKKGAFSMAAKNNVPVLPCFITMQDSDVLGEDGFYVQEYTVHIGKPIYPDPDSAVGENAERMKDENYLLWKDIYENNYGIPLVYA